MMTAGLVLLVEVWASMAGLNGTTTGHRPLPKRETDQTREADHLQDTRGTSDRLALLPP